MLDPDGAGPLNPELWIGGSLARAQQLNGTRINVSGIARWNGSTQLWSGVTRGAGESNVVAFLVDEQSAGPDPINNLYPNAGPLVYVVTNSTQSQTPYLMAYIPSGGGFSRIDFGATDFYLVDEIMACLAKHNGQIYFGGAFAQSVQRITADGTSHEPLPAVPVLSVLNFDLSQASGVVGSMISYQSRLLIAPQYPAGPG